MSAHFFPECVKAHGLCCCLVPPAQNLCILLRVDTVLNIFGDFSQVLQQVQNILATAIDISKSLSGLYSVLICLFPLHLHGVIPIALCI